MQWISQNWVWLLFFAAFIGMHLFGHGGHGGHSNQPDRGNKEVTAAGAGPTSSPNKPMGDQH